MYVCKHPELDLTITGSRTKLFAFDGPHPAGLPGTHIHYLHPASRDRQVWYVDVQDVIAFRRFFKNGAVPVERHIALAGPEVKNPVYIKTRLGASVDEITRGRLTEGKQCVLSGSVLSGRRAEAAVAFLGRYHNSVNAIAEGNRRYLLGWLSLGFNKFSSLGIYLSNWIKPKSYQFSSTTNGSERAMVPMATYEKVMPLDMLATQLLRAIFGRRFNKPQKVLGALELEEEDLSLCTFVCPGKYEYGPIFARCAYTHRSRRLVRHY